MSRTKKVDGCCLNADNFAFVGDHEDVRTWKLALHFAGDPAKTRNHIRNALVRFTETKDIPASALPEVAQRILGACKAHGIKIDAGKLFDVAAKSTSTLPVVNTETAKQEREAKDREALEDLAADRHYQRMTADIEEIESQLWKEHAREKLATLIRHRV